MSGDRLHPLVQHLHVAAQWNRCQHEFGVIDLATSSEQGFAETDRKSLHLDANLARHPEVTELVNRNEDSQRQDESEHAKRYIAEHEHFIDGVTRNGWRMLGVVKITGIACRRSVCLGFA